MNTYKINLWFRGAFGAIDSVRVLHVRSDTGVQALHVDESPRTCAHMYPSTSARDILDCKDQQRHAKTPQFQGENKHNLKSEIRSFTVDVFQNLVTLSFRYTVRPPRVCFHKAQVSASTKHEAEKRAHKNQVSFPCRLPAALCTYRDLQRVRAGDSSDRQRAVQGAGDLP